MAWAPDYATLTEGREFITRSAVTADDAQISLAITTASRAIDDHCHRQFGQLAAPEARFYTPWWDRTCGRWVIPIDDLQTTVGLVLSLDLDGTGAYASTVTEYALRPVNASQDGKPWTQIHVLPSSAVQPTGKDAQAQGLARWGWTTVPTPVKQAALLQSSRFLARRDSPYGIAGSPDLGSELRLLARVDPDVAVSLRKYIRWWAAA